MLKILRFIGIPDDGSGVVVHNVPPRFVIKFNGNAEILDLLPLSPKDYHIETLLLPLIFKENLKEDLEFSFEIHLVFNEICNPDACKRALESAIQILDLNPQVPVINHPRFILETSRDKIYEKLNRIKGLYIPKTIRLRPSSLQEIAEIAEKEEMYPFLFRKATHHTNIEVPIIKGKDDIKLLEIYPFMGEEYYLTKFVDYSSHDSLYRKYRIFFIDGKLYPRHLIISDQWNIHARDRNRLMDHKEKFREEERRWFEEFREEDYAPLIEIAKHLQLDFFIIDYALLKDGTIVLFEATPCCFYIIGRVEDIDLKYSYQIPYIRTIEEAFVNMINSKVKKFLESRSESSLV